MTMSSEANKLTVSGMESSARVSQSVAPEFRVAAMSQDEASYQSRLPALVKRMGKILGEALNGEEEHDVRTAGAESLDDFAVTIAQRSQSLREDKAAKKAITGVDFAQLPDKVGVTADHSIAKGAGLKGLGWMGSKDSVDSRLRALNCDPTSFVCSGTAAQKKEAMKIVKSIMVGPP